MSKDVYLLGSSKNDGDEVEFAGHEIWKYQTHALQVERIKDVGCVELNGVYYAAAEEPETINEFHCEVNGNDILTCDYGCEHNVFLVELDDEKVEALRSFIMIKKLVSTDEEDAL